jgi:hypothetical protein
MGQNTSAVAPMESHCNSHDVRATMKVYASVSRLRQGRGRPGRLGQPCRPGQLDWLGRFACASAIAALAITSLAAAWPTRTLAQSPSADAAAARNASARASAGKPFLRIERTQTCLREFALYRGAISGTVSAATSRAVHRLIEQRDPLLYKALAGPNKKSEELTRRDVQAQLYAACRDVLARVDRDRAAEPEDRCGTASRYAAARKTCVCIEGHVRYDGLCLPRVDDAGRSVQSVAPIIIPAIPAIPVPQPIAPNVSVALPPAQSEPAKTAPPVASLAADVAPVTCLPSDLKALLPRRVTQRTTLPVCELPCLSPPAGLKAGDLRQYEQEAGIAWCNACIPFGAYLPLEDVERIERAGNLTLCRQAPRSAVNFETDSRPGGVRIFRGPRALFSRRQAAVPHGNVAVIVTLQRYTSGLTGPAHAGRDGIAMRALLTERLGYQSDNIVELRDAGLSDFVRMFGSAASPKGELWDRLNARSVAPGATLLVYVSGLGAFRAADPGAFLLPVDAERGREETSGYPLVRLIDNLARLGAPAATVLLEVDFSRSSGQMVLTPNAPEAADALLPAGTKGAVAILTAADRDQRTLEDPEYGIGLFTKHVVAGLSGAADLAPIGNGDNAIDPLELYVHAAYRVGLAARRSFGVTQKPSLFRSHAQPIARLTGIVN